MPDLRGHGWTSAPAGGYDKEQLATDLLGLLDALELPGGPGRPRLGRLVGLPGVPAGAERFCGSAALGIVHPFPSPDLRVLQAWRGTYQVVLGTPVLGSGCCATRARRGGAAWAPPAGAAHEPLRSRSRRCSASRSPVPARRCTATRVLGRPPMLRLLPGARLPVPTRLLVRADDPARRPLLRLEGSRTA